MNEIDHAVKAQRCSVRRTKPIGPLTLCDHLPCFDFCLKYSKRDIERGMNEKKGPYKNPKVWDEDLNEGKSRHCFCGKKIAKPHTNFGSFKGMFVCHLRAKHPKLYEQYKNEEVEVEQLFFWK